MIGRRLAHYAAVSRLGKGGMGEVYLAEDTKLGRCVALKVLPPEVAADPERRMRFEREARAVAALNHPSIVTVHSVEEADGVPFITMELVEGQTLSALLSGRALPLSRLLEVAIPLADAVGCAHRSGIIHRDLKPDNVMVDGQGRLKVLDFGLARVDRPSGPEDAGTQTPTVSLDTREGTILGTVAYMSPEQAEGRPVDSRSDVFSLGIMLYEMATGVRPFQGATPMSTISSILKDEPTPVSDRDPTLPERFGRIVRRCLAKDPDRRYQTALDLRNDLEDVRVDVDSGELAADSRAHAAAARKPTLRGPIVLTAAALVAAVAVISTVSRRTGEDPATVYVPRPLTSAIGQEADVNWSPGSDFIAFGEIRNGSFDVYVQPVVGGTAELRAGGPGTETCPRFSPDGKLLAYVSSSEPGTPVMLVPPHGGTARRLVSTNIRTLDVDSISFSMGDHPWSSDSRSLLVSRLDPEGRAAVYRVDRDTGDTEQVTFPPPGSADQAPSHSFDGEQIVFQRRTGGKGALLTMPVGGGEPRTVLADEFDNTHPTWRPDGRHIVFLSDRSGSGSQDVWEVDLSSSATRQLTFESNRVTYLSLSADNRLAYIPFWHDTFLFVVDVASGERRQLNAHAKDNFGARFSPDGQAVAYHSTRTGNSEIWLHHLDDRPETQITDRSSWDLYPDWSPAGDRMIFVSDRHESMFKLFIANRDGGGEQLLVDKQISLDSQYAPVVGSLVSRWSPDGEHIAFLVEGEKTQALWTVRADGTGAREVIANAISFDWYRDGRRGVYARHHGSESEMIAIDLETGQERSLFVGPFVEMDVAPDGSAISFCHGRGHMAMGLAVLQLAPPTEPGGLPRAVGEPRYVVATSGTWHVHNGGWSPDSKQIVYTRDMDYGDIYELVERR